MAQLRESANSQVSLMDASSPLSSVGAACKLQTLSKQAFEGERRPDGSVLHPASAALCADADGSFLRRKDHKIFKQIY